MVRHVDMEGYNRVYYISSGDTMSLSKIPNKGEYRVVYRARRILQSWWTTPITTLMSMVHAVWLVYMDAPDLMLLNGPGTCLVLVIAARVLSWIRIIRPTRVIFIESFARVASLSLTGRILLRLKLTNRFLIMWEELARLYDGVEYVGLLV